MSHQVADRDALSDLETEVVDAVSADDAWDLLETFSGLERVSGTADEATAATDICDRLSAANVDYERHEPELYVSQPHGATIKTPTREFNPGPVKTVSFSANADVEGPVEYVGGAGAGALSGGADDPRGPFYDVGDLSDTIALTSMGSLSVRAVNDLADRGAIGVVAIHEHENEPHNGIATPVWGGAPCYDEQDRMPDIPIVNVNARDGSTLREWAGSNDGLHVELSTDLTTGWMECPLVVAEIEGEADPEEDDFVLLHGHYDSWYVGITDNATGDAGLLEAAKAFDTHSDSFARNLRVAWWPAHSTGRYAGSTWYADEFAHELVKHCVAQVNMDSPGAADATEYTDMSCWCPEAHDLVGGTIEDVAAAPYAEEFPHRAGDYSFDNLGVTGLLMLSSNIPAAEREARGYHTVGGCGGNSDAWHLSTDTLDKAGREEFVRDVQMYCVAVARLLNAKVLPLDHSRTVEKLRAAVDRYAEVAGDRFDFGPTREALDALAADLDAFTTAVDTGDVAPNAANEAIKTLSRTLTRLYLTTEGRYEQDPATGREPLPRYAVVEVLPVVDEETAGFVRTQLRREQNTVVGELRRARAAIPEVDA
jgi:hypothetical protein